MGHITKTSLYKFDPLQPHFYTVKLGFTGVYIIFLILLNNIDCGHTLEPPRWGGSNEYPQSMFWAEIWKISGFLSELFLEILEVKSSICLNRHVFVMYSISPWCYLHTCKCHIFNQCPTNVYVYIQIYTEIYICISLEGCDFNTFYARKLKFGMLLTQT